MQKSAIFFKGITVSKHKYHCKFIMFVSFSVYSSGFSPTFVLMLSRVSTTTSVSTHPSIVNVFEVVVTLSRIEATNVITNLKIFSNKLNEEDIFVRNFIVVKLFKYCFING